MGGKKYCFFEETINSNEKRGESQEESFREHFLREEKGFHTFGKNFNLESFSYGCLEFRREEYLQEEDDIQDSLKKYPIFCVWRDTSAKFIE